MKDGTKMTNEELLEMFDAYLDEVHGDATVAGHQYATSRALKLMDPIAYHQEFLDWEDGRDEGR